MRYFKLPRSRTVNTCVLANYICVPLTTWAAHSPCGCLGESGGFTPARSHLWDQVSKAAAGGSHLCDVLLSAPDSSCSQWKLFGDKNKFPALSPLGTWIWYRFKEGNAIYRKNARIALVYVIQRDHLWCLQLGERQLCSQQQPIYCNFALLYHLLHQKAACWFVCALHFLHLLVRQPCPDVLIPASHPWALGWAQWAQDGPRSLCRLQESQPDMGAATRCGFQLCDPDHRLTPQLHLQSRATAFTVAGQCQLIPRGAEHCLPELLLGCLEVCLRPLLRSLHSQHSWGRGWALSLGAWCWLYLLKAPPVVTAGRGYLVCYHPPWQRSTFERQISNLQVEDGGSRVGE